MASDGLTAMKEPENPYDSPKDFSNEATEREPEGYISAAIACFFLLAIIALFFIFFLGGIFSMGVDLD